MPIIPMSEEAWKDYEAQRAAFVAARDEFFRAVVEKMDRTDDGDAEGT
jgi:hypothetical protein